MRSVIRIGVFNGASGVGGSSIFFEELGSLVVNEVKDEANSLKTVAYD